MQLGCESVRTKLMNSLAFSVYLYHTDMNQFIIFEYFSLLTYICIVQILVRNGVSSIHRYCISEYKYVKWLIQHQFQQQWGIFSNQMKQNNEQYANQLKISAYSNASNLENKPPMRVKIFGILLIIMQMTICLIYGFTIRIPTSPIMAPNDSLVPLIVNCFHFLIVLFGFGSLFGYLRQMLWSAIGFNLLITCLTVQWYFLFSKYWAIALANKQNFSPNIARRSNIFLAYSQQQFTLMSDNLEGTLSEAIKCALANCMAFSAILGLGGPLQAFIVSLLGTIGYQLMKNVVDIVHFDFGGTFLIFAYGGFMGIIMKFVLSKKSGYTTARKDLYRYDQDSLTISFLGASVLFSLLPALLIDRQPNSVQQDAAPHTFINGPLSVWYSMASSCLTAISISLIKNGGLRTKQLITPLVAGGIVCLSSSLYIKNPVYAMIGGAGAGIFQMVGQFYLQNSQKKCRKVSNSYSFIIFGFQTIWGGAYSSILRHLGKKNRTQGFDYEQQYLQKGAEYDFYIALMCAGFGLVYGLIIGGFLYCLGRHSQQQNLSDFTYWSEDDGIMFINKNKDQKSEGISADIFIRYSTTQTQ